MMCWLSRLVTTDTLVGKGDEADASSAETGGDSSSPPPPTAAAPDPSSVPHSWSPTSPKSAPGMFILTLTKVCASTSAFSDRTWLDFTPAFPTLMRCFLGLVHSSMVFATKTTTLLAFSSAIALAAAWPIKTMDYSNTGDDCDTSKEQYLQVEGYDYHDYPKFTMRWTQLSGECGAETGDLKSWEETYDSDAGDETPNGEGRVQLNIFVCAPFGHYEIGLDIDSYSEEGSQLEQRTAWELENGPDEHHIWDTVNTDLKTDPAYSPTTPGEYTWPFEGETGYYRILYTGPLPPTKCPASVPEGTEYKGCYEDSRSARVFDSEPALVLSEIGKSGMTTHECSKYCSEYAYFSVEFGKECFCGTEDEFNDATLTSSPDSCGNHYDYLCTGDATTACGGRNAMSVYHRTGVPPPPTPAPVTPPISPPGSYVEGGCYEDSKSSRLMAFVQSADDMTAEVCSGLCDGTSNTHFGTQYGKECWCGSPDLPAEPLHVGECDFACTGDAREKCGGYNRMNVYKIEGDDGGVTGYQGCYRDSKTARVMGYKTSSGDMKNEDCRTRCDENGTKYYGTQYGIECWCGDSFGNEPAEGACTYACAGDAAQQCGGYNALSVYTVA